ncbi:hypothetical protein TrRE_jg7477 [Triparma retinervis]|uniref:Sodium/calcium exchanger membrane region domain-containing protein n=1 Tax=Triparma retinervis TaxID=2557542 RepID=A0A9W7AQU6_9STRA|nr:hypothetical protein TrRE_jg7477 [Triparma retinervis]
MPRRSQLPLATPPENGQARPLRFTGIIISSLFAVNVCFKAYLKNKDLVVRGSSEGEGDLWRRLEESEDDGDSCKVNGIADPLGQYFDQAYDSLFYLLGMFYMFYGLGYVCEEYFVVAIEKIISEYSIPPDVAGATLMAAGSSSPELFAEIVGCFISEDNSAGTGTVIGSAIFNQLVIIGGALLLSPGGNVEFDVAPLIRDISFYVLSIVWLFVGFRDSKIVAWEAWGFMLTYFLYVLVNAYWSKIVRLSFIQKLEGESITGGDLSLYIEGQNEDNGKGSLTEELMVDNYINDLDARPNDRRISKDQERAKSRTRSRYDSTGTYHWDDEELSVAMSDGIRGSFNPANEHLEESAFGRLIGWVTYPLVLILSCLLVDCKKHPKQYWASFTTSIIILGLLVFFIIQWVEKAGCLIGFGSALMGLTVGAGGTSAPDALVSFHVARNGVGDMAVSNALGSNVFDILLCLGLPWVIKTTAMGEEVEVSTDDFNNTFMIMVGVLLLFTVNLVISYCRHGRIILSRRSGYLYLFLYLCFVIFSVLYCETDVFGAQDED